MIDVLFATPEHCLSPISGGQQLYTREILGTLTQAGFRLTVIALPTDRSWRARIRRRLNGNPYQCPYSTTAITSLCDQAVSSCSRLVLLNGVSFLECTALLRQRLPEKKLVLVSHGLESTDYVHELQSQPLQMGSLHARNSQLRRLGQQLLIECQQLGGYDAVLGLSHTEAEIHRWLGARSAFWLPRSIHSAPIPWIPLAKRVGFVGTLDHPPNIGGLKRVLAILDDRGEDVTVRVVGSPEKVGRKLEQRFRAVHYLGTLSDDELVREASSWRAFLHPVFCVARGASTKLATALNWGIPIVATTAGRRGYQWKSGELIQANSPTEFVDQMIRLANDDSYMHRTRQQVLQAAHSSPTMDQNANVLRCILKQVLEMSPNSQLRFL